MFVNFADIPGNKNLMLDFIYEFEKTEKYGLKNFRDLDTIAEHVKTAAGNEFPHRAKLVEIIKRQYSDFSPSQATKKNINSLHSPKTLAVVAAQQIGLFGGPLQYFYKIITAIKLAEKFNDVFEEYNFVPVFWLESEDHDFENAHKTYTYNYDKAIRKLVYDDGMPPEENRGSVGEIVLGKQIERTLDELKNTLKRTEHTNALLELLGNSYRENSKLKDAFKRLLFELFDERGLIIFESNTRETKTLAKDLFRESIENHEALAILGIQRSARLENEYHAQIKIHPVNLYFLENDKRYRIEVHEKGFKIGNKRKIFSREEMLGLIDETPERFSPDVIFRPLMQDAILPVAVTVAGRDEMNYFPQIVPYYEYFGLETPLLYPRASVTLNEKYLRKKIDKYGLTHEQIFILDEKELAKKILYAQSDSDIDKIFAETAANIDLAMDSLAEKLALINPELFNDTEEVKQGAVKLLEILKEKAESSYSVKEQNILRHVKTLKNQFAPNGKLQEDVINFAYFANHYGLDFIKFLFDEILINRFEHQIIDI